MSKTKENLSPYEIFQLEKYGNILPGYSNHLSQSDSEDEEETLSTSELNYIFSSQNESHDTK